MATNIVQNSEFLGRSVPAVPAETGARPIVVQPDISSQQISERAYYIFLARNGQPGSPDADWTRAERELRAEALRKAPLTLESAAHATQRTTAPLIQAGAGVPSVAGVNARRTPVLFSGG